MGNANSPWQKSCRREKWGLPPIFGSPVSLETKHFDERKSGGSPHFLPEITSTTGC